MTISAGLSRSPAKILGGTSVEIAQRGGSCEAIPPAGSDPRAELAVHLKHAGHLASLAINYSKPDKLGQSASSDESIAVALARQAEQRSERHG